MSSPAGWHVEMAQWVSKVKAAETAENIEGHDAALQVIKNWYMSSSKWKPMTLDTLFGGTKPSLPLRIVEVDEEEVMQQIMAKALEDEKPDNGAIDNDTDDEW